MLSMLIISANAVEDNEETTLLPREKPTSADGLPEVVADGEKFYPEVYFGGEVFYAKYTPEQSGAVVIWSGGSMETFRMIYDENMKLLKENSDLLQTNVVNSDGHLGLLYWVEAGKTYIIGVGMYEAALTPEPITVWMDFYSHYYDPAPLPPQQTITDAIKLPRIFADGEWRGAQVYHGGNAYYRFTPEQSGTIMLWSSGPMETFRMIYDENMNLLELNSDLYSDVIRDPSGKTASTFDVVADKTYIIGFGMYEIETRMSFCVEYAEQPTDATEPTTETVEPTTEETETTAPSTENSETTTESAQSATEATQPTTSATEPTEPATEQPEPTTETEVKAKKANKMTVTVKDKKVKVKNLKKNKVTVKAITVKKANGTVTFSKVAKKSSSRLTVNAKTGKITVKKGTKKGTYKITVMVCAKGTKTISQRL